MKLISLFRKNEHGGGMVEYVLIVVLIALAAIAAEGLPEFHHQSGFCQPCHRRFPSAKPERPLRSSPECICIGYEYVVGH